MREWQRLAVLLVALYVYDRYAKAKGQTVDWGLFVLSAVAFDLLVYALKGL